MVDINDLSTDLGRVIELISSSGHRDTVTRTAHVAERLRRRPRDLLSFRAGSDLPVMWCGSSGGSTGQEEF